MNTPPHLVIRHTELEPDAPMPDMSEVERRLERLKVERERLGAVNLRAEEEQKELSERLETIVSEREDVIEAIRKLRQAIQSLNREGRERLLSAFDVVNGHFQRLFTHLFGGGTAELQLIELEDPLEAGLEILARPPGKKPQTMTLLSGGEQALTALALIFAVFLTNPAPICVLDEVDAPLDDHNVERFCNLMDEMARTTETRFVIITHNPITMARMNRLFGVTMAEQGVSQWSPSTFRKLSNCGKQAIQSFNRWRWRLAEVLPASSSSGLSPRIHAGTLIVGGAWHSGTLRAAFIFRHGSAGSAPSLRFSSALG